VATRSAIVVALMLSAACGIHREPRLEPPGLAADRDISLNGHTLGLHIADVRTRPRALLLLYATGDGGWHRKDLDVYRRLVAWGYPVAGFDAHDYVTHLGGEPTTTPERVAHDYQTMIDAARHALSLPASLRVVLVGVSRGAGLAVVAAGEPLLRDELAGVVVAGLTKEEEYVRWYRRIGPHRSETREMVQIYEYLTFLAPLPITVIQSTRDKYLPAESARALFGPDKPGRQLIAIDARNHSFAGARDEMYAAVKSAIDALSGTDLTHSMPTRRERSRDRTQSTQKSRVR
jgi:fermentation-respiration switch protein FrsA (DUF1100 family)